MATSFWRLPPRVHSLSEVSESEEIVIRLALFGHRARNRRARIFEIRRRVARPARLAVVAVLIGRAALGTLALDEAVGQEHVLDRVIGLGDGAPGDVAGVTIALVDQGRVVLILGRVGRVVVVEADAEGGKVGLMFGGDPGDELLGRDALLARAQHDRRAVGVVGADVPAVVTAHLLEPRPDVGLDVLDQMTDVDRAIGIGQGAGDEDVAGLGHGWLGWMATW